MNKNKVEPIRVVRREIVKQKLKGLSIGRVEQYSPFASVSLRYDVPGLLSMSGSISLNTNVNRLFFTFLGNREFECSDQEPERMAAIITQKILARQKIEEAV